MEFRSVASSRPLLTVRSARKSLSLEAYLLQKIWLRVKPLNVAQTFVICHRNRLS